MLVLVVKKVRVIRSFIFLTVNGVLNAASIIVVVMLAALSAEAGNGTDRGGGDGAALQFQAAGMLAANELRKLQVQSPQLLTEINPSVLEKIIPEVELIPLDCLKEPNLCKRFLTFKGQKKHAVNERKRSHGKTKLRIWLDTLYWNSLQNDLDRIAFAFHEYLRFIVNHKDAKYRYSSEFRALLERSQSLEKAQTQFNSYLDEFTTAYRAERNFTQDQILSVLRLLMASSEYQNCQDFQKPKSKTDPAKIEILVECLAILPLIEAVFPSTKDASSEVNTTYLLQILDLAIQLARQRGYEVSENDSNSYHEKLNKKLVTLTSKISEIKKINQKIPQFQTNLSLEKWNQLSNFTNAIVSPDLRWRASEILKEVNSIVTRTETDLRTMTEIKEKLDRSCRIKAAYNEYIACTFKTFIQIIMTEFIPKSTLLIEQMAQEIEATKSRWGYGR